MRPTVKGSIRDCKTSNDASQEEKTQPRCCRISTIELKNRLIQSLEKDAAGGLRRPLGHVPKKLLDVFDQDMLHLLILSESLSIK